MPSQSNLLLLKKCFLKSKKNHPKGNVCEGGGYIISVVLFSFVYNASKFFEFETTYYQEVCTAYSSSLSSLVL